MKRVNSIPRAFFSTLEERAEIIRFARAIGLPTFTTQPESASLSLFKAGVLAGHLLSSVLLYILISTLRNFGKVFSPTRARNHNTVNARWVQL